MSEHNMGRDRVLLVAALSAVVALTAFVSLCIYLGLSADVPSSSGWLFVGAGGLALAVVAVVLCAPLGAVQSLMGGRTPLMERLPREIAAPTLFIPLASSMSGSVLTVSVLLFSLTLSPDPDIAATYRAYTVILGFLAILVGVGAPVAGYRLVQEEREGRDVALFDSRSNPVLVANRLAQHWEELRGRKRVFLTVHRVRALGGASAPSSASWPRNWEAGSVWLRPKRVFAFLAVVGIAPLGVFYGAFRLLGSSTELATAVRLCFLLSIFVLVVVALLLVAYVQLQSEQGRAEMLRSAEQTMRTVQQETRDAEKKETSLAHEDSTGEVVHSFISRQLIRVAASIDRRSRMP